MTRKKIFSYKNYFSLINFSIISYLFSFTGIEKKLQVMLENVKIRQHVLQMVWKQNPHIVI